MRKQKFDSLADKKVWGRAIKHLRRNDKVLARVIDRVGPIKFEMHWDYYEAIVRSFIYQQISSSAGDAILAKFEAMFGDRLPQPKEFLKAPEKRIRSAGISPQKYSYIKDLCQRIVNGDLDLDSLDGLPDEEVIAILDEVKGIGRWTAEMFLMFSLHRANVFAADDLGLKNALKHVYGLKRDPSRETLDKITARWQPYRSIAALYLWRSKEGDKWDK